MLAPNGRATGMSGSVPCRIGEIHAEWEDAGPMGRAARRNPSDRRPGPRPGRSRSSGDENLPGITTGFMDDSVYSPPPMRRPETRGSSAPRLTAPASSGSTCPGANWWGRFHPRTRPIPPIPTTTCGHIDAAVQSAHAAGLDVLLTVYSAPDWAEGPNRPDNLRPGSWMPDPKAFGEFGQMLATRYSGNYAGCRRFATSRPGSSRTYRAICGRSGSARRLTAPSNIATC